MQTRNLIAFKFGTQEEGYKVHLRTIFGLNTSNTGKVRNDFSQKKK